MKRILGKLLCAYLILSISFAVAEEIQTGDEWMNVGGPKDIFSFPTFASDVISSLAVGEPCVIRSVEGDWLEIAFYKEMLGHQTGWITAEGMERVNSADLPSANLPIDSPITPSYHTDFGSAYVTSANGNCVHLREAQSIHSESLGLYYPGVRVHCNSSIEQEWVSVLIGNRSGYMKSNFLTRENDGVSSMPVRQVRNPRDADWLNLRSAPSKDSAVINKYFNGEQVTVLGIVNDEWLHVQLADGNIGFMMSSYLQAGGIGNIETAFQNPSLGSSTRLRTTQHMDFGYSVDASVTETREGILDINILVTFDPDYTTNDDIASFNLYLNGEQAACVYPYWDKDNRILAPTTFYASIGYRENIYEAYLVPVHEEWGEYSHQRIYLQENFSSQFPPATPETGTTRLYVDAQVVPGCTVHANLTQTTGDILSANVFLTFDSNYTTNDDIVSFNLYLNGQYAANVGAYWDNDNKILAATTFYAAVHFKDSIRSAYLLPVFEESGEDNNRMLYLK